MILDNISRALKEQNWLAAGIEFVIVILGVVIGFQIQAWNEERQDASLGQLYAARLIEDLETEQRRSDIFAGYFRQVEDFANTAIDLFDEPAGVSDEAFLIAVYNATQVIRRPQARATFDELVATGSLRLVKPRQLTQRAIQHYSNDQRGVLYDYVFSSDFRNTVRRSMPYRVQEAIRTQCGDVRNQAGVVVAMEADCSIDLPSALIEEAAERIRSDAGLLGDLRVFLSTFDAFIGDVERQSEMLERVLGAYGRHAAP
jgi:hypothetical protein